MKVHELLATNSEVCVSLEPETPAEVALVNLMTGCDAKCETGVEEPKNGLLITVKVKTRY